MSDNNEARILHLTHLLWNLEKRVKILEEWTKDLDDRFSAHENKEPIP